LYKNSKIVAIKRVTRKFQNAFFSRIIKMRPARAKKGMTSDPDRTNRPDAVQGSVSTIMTYLHGIDIRVTEDDLLRPKGYRIRQLYTFLLEILVPWQLEKMQKEKENVNAHFSSNVNNIKKKESLLILLIDYWKRNDGGYSCFQRIKPIITTASIYRARFTRRHCAEIEKDDGDLVGADRFHGL
jgi:hypothetical protein